MSQGFFLFVLEDGMVEFIVTNTHLSLARISFFISVWIDWKRVTSCISFWKVLCFISEPWYALRSGFGPVEVAYVWLVHKWLHQVFFPLAAASQEECSMCWVSKLESKDHELLPSFFSGWVGESVSIVLVIL